MKYFEEIDAWLSALLEGPEEEESGEEWFSRAKSAIKDKLLESYRNGQKAGPKSPKESGADAAEKPKRRWPPEKRGSSYRKPERQ